MNKPGHPLTPKQQRFVDEYLVDLNATQAAIRAGYSARTAEQAGSRLLRNVQVVARIQQKNGKRLQKVELTADRVLQEIARIAFFDPRKLFDAAGNPVPIDQLDDDTAAVVAGLDIVIERTSEDRDGGLTTVHKYRLADKKGALALAMRHLGLLHDKVHVTGQLTLAQLVEAANKQAGEGDAGGR